MLNGSSPEVRLPLYFKQKKDPYQAAIEIIADNDSYSIPEDDQSFRKELRRQRGLYGSIRRVKLKRKNGDSYSSIGKLAELADQQLGAALDKISRSTFDTSLLNGLDNTLTESRTSLVNANKAVNSRLVVNLKDIEFYSLCRQFDCVVNSDEVNLTKVIIDCEKLMVGLKIECNRILNENKKILKLENDKKEMDRLERMKRSATKLIRHNYSEVHIDSASRQDTLCKALEKVYRSSRMKWRLNQKEFYQLMHSNLTSSLNVFQLRDFLMFHFSYCDVSFSIDESFALLKYWITKNQQKHDIAANILDFKIENILQREFDIVDNVMFNSSSNSDDKDMSLDDNSHDFQHRSLSTNDVMYKHDADNHDSRSIHSQSTTNTSSLSLVSSTKPSALNSKGSLNHKLNMYHRRALQQDLLVPLKRHHNSNSDVRLPPIAINNNSNNSNSNSKGGSSVILMDNDPNSHMNGLRNNNNNSNNNNINNNNHHQLTKINNSSSSSKVQGGFDPLIELESADDRVSADFVVAQIKLFGLWKPQEE